MNHLTRSEFKSLVQSVRNPKHRLMLKVGFNHGLRVSELINLTEANIRDGYVDVQRLKGSMRTIQRYQASDDPLLDEAQELKAMAATLKPGERLFHITRSGVDKLMKRCGKRAGIPQHKLFPHVLKHSIAMQTIKGAGIENVRQWLGHKSISSTGSYLRVSDEAASQAISRAMSEGGGNTW